MSAIRGAQKKRTAYTATLTARLTPDFPEGWLTFVLEEAVADFTALLVMRLPTIPAFFLAFCQPVFAMTESEIQDQVNAMGKEAASGSVLIWFLCAIAFLKVSQKIDSFMSSLGINVGHTGGSMLEEAMMAESKEKSRCRATRKHDPFESFLFLHYNLISALLKRVCKHSSLYISDFVASSAQTQIAV